MTFQKGLSLAEQASSQAQTGGVPLARQWPEAVSVEAEIAGTAYLVHC